MSLVGKVGAAPAEASALTYQAAETPKWDGLRTEQ